MRPDVQGLSPESPTSRSTTRYPFVIDLEYIEPSGFPIEVAEERCQALRLFGLYLLGSTDIVQGEAEAPDLGSAAASPGVPPRPADVGLLLTCLSG
jgi:hypothetical protein